MSSPNSPHPPNGEKALIYEDPNVITLVQGVSHITTSPNARKKIAEAPDGKMVDNLSSVFFRVHNTIDANIPALYCSTCNRLPFSSVQVIFCMGDIIFFDTPEDGLVLAALTGHCTHFFSVTTSSNSVILTYLALGKQEEGSIGELTQATLPQKLNQCGNLIEGIIKRHFAN